MDANLVKSSPSTSRKSSVHGQATQNLHIHQSNLQLKFHSLEPPPPPKQQRGSHSDASPEPPLLHRRLHGPPPRFQLGGRPVCAPRLGSLPQDSRQEPWSPLNRGTAWKRPDPGGGCPLGTESLLRTQLTNGKQSRRPREDPGLGPHGPPPPPPPHRTGPGPRARRAPHPRVPRGGTPTWQFQVPRETEPSRSPPETLPTTASSGGCFRLVSHHRLSPTVVPSPPGPQAPWDLYGGGGRLSHPHLGVRCQEKPCPRVLFSLGRASRQGSEPGHRGDLRQSCSKARSSTHRATAGTPTRSDQSTCRPSLTSRLLCRLLQRTPGDSGSGHLGRPPRGSSDQLP